MIRMLLVAALLAIALVSCGQDTPEDAAPPGDDAAAPATARFVAVDIAFDEAPSELPAGDVTVELTNEGEIAHNVVFEQAGDEPVAEAAAGETAGGTVRLEPGEQVFYCSQPGHRDAGMEGTVSVTG